NSFGLVNYVDEIIDAVSNALLSNLLTVLQETTITTQINSIELETTTVIGDVIIEDGDLGGDTPVAGTSVTRVEYEGVIYAPDANGDITVKTEYGILVLGSAGQYTYTLTNTDGLGQTEVFTYTAVNTNDGSSGTATLTINIGDVSIGDVNGTYQDTGSSTTDTITNDGLVTVTGLEAGATLQYRLDGGDWIAVTGNSFELT